ncbi:hypothetical protein KCP77_22430 [Salmonella enterica subsp. enterica]|nr:hypothetical protein KCP77_22430 [Salmonella enterica subsp. enterica]
MGLKGNNGMFMYCPHEFGRGCWYGVMVLPSRYRYQFSGHQRSWYRHDE